MTEAELSQYRAIKLEIEDLSFRIEQLREQKLQMTSTKVKGSLPDFPYTEVHYSVAGPDKEEEERRLYRISELERKKRDKQTELIEKEHEMHDFVYTVPDSNMRQILILRFIDGHTQDTIGRKLHMDQSLVSKKLTDFFKSA
jgi:DNA-directed RNA polymerase specialized sigma subunit